MACKVSKNDIFNYKLKKTKSTTKKQSLKVERVALEKPNSEVRSNQNIRHFYNILKFDFNKTWASDSYAVNCQTLQVDSKKKMYAL